MVNFILSLFDYNFEGREGQEGAGAFLLLCTAVEDSHDGAVPAAVLGPWGQAGLQPRGRGCPSTEAQRDGHPEVCAEPTTLNSGISQPLGFFLGDFFF